ALLGGDLDPGRFHGSPHIRAVRPVRDPGVALVLVHALPLLPDVLQHDRDDPPHLLGPERADGLGHHQVGRDLVDPPVHAARTAARHAHAPTSRVRPSWAISSDSIATALCVALSDGPTHFIGMPRLNFQTLAGSRDSSIKMIRPSLRLPAPWT